MHTGSGHTVQGGRNWYKGGSMCRWLTVRTTAGNCCPHANVMHTEKTQHRLQHGDQPPMHTGKASICDCIQLITPAGAQQRMSHAHCHSLP
jgi:hypothetical protein